MWAEAADRMVGGCIRLAPPRGMAVSSRYEIVVVGDVGPTVLGALPGFELQPSPDETSRLVGTVPDAAGLQGALNRLNDLRVELIELRRLPD